jgi:hypothetical protein
MIRVLEFGSAKYSADNWKKGLNREEVLESMQRHLDALFDGEEEDSESKISHIGHIMCNCIFYVYHQARNSFVGRRESYGAHFQEQVKQLKDGKVTGTAHEGS